MEFESTTSTIAEQHNDHGWQKVTYAKKKRKNPVPLNSVSNGSVISNNNNNTDNVFSVIEKKSEERRKVIEAQKSSSAVYDDDLQVRSSKTKKNYSDYEDSDEEVVENRLDVNNDVEKKKKVKKVKKPKVTMAEAVAKIDVDELASFLVDITNLQV
ncbi:putative transmembrane protein [Helianthus annuus]|nr:putative transmembrane protein [Helianthus annuus]